MGVMAMALTRESAKHEVAKRELARRHLVDFSEYIAPYYRASKHHVLVGDYLELVETYIRTRGQNGIGRLLILEPPRHGKSEQASRHFPAWVMGRMPDTRVIVTSYNSDLATKFSRATRDIIDSEEYRAVFGELSSVNQPVGLSTDSRSVQGWDLAAPHRGGLMAAGVGGGITGSGANLFIVDDPFKNREEAESDSHRERVWDWWTSSAYTRLEDYAAVVGMLTRWHGDDWAGRLLKMMASDPKADQWVVVCLPAIWEKPTVPEGKTFAEYQRDQMLEGVWVDAEDPLIREEGEALWHEKYSAEDLERIKANLGAYDFAALYQQTPYSRAGGYFQRENFAIVEAPAKAEEIVSRVRAWDKAGTKSGTGGDYAVGVRMSMTVDEVVYVEHVSRGQYTPMTREEEILKCARMDGQLRGVGTVTWHQQDPGDAGLTAAQATNRMLAKHGFSAHFQTMSGDKEVRAGPWSTAVEGGQARLVRGGWNEAFIEEHISFPKAKYDDQVDAASFGFSKLHGRSRKDVRSYQG
jgi:predicted phage terminase large subunit-like protein